MVCSGDSIDSDPYMSETNWDAKVDLWSVSEDPQGELIPKLAKVMEFFLMNMDKLGGFKGIFKKTEELASLGPSFVKGAEPAAILGKLGAL